ncbi:MAG: outer membrane protein transport protein [Nitrosomonadales bacterium]|nr:outer membrane protein transport protein [Nitrosomonadales bacterium]
MRVNKIVVSLFAAGIMASPLANATNGMFMEGYGPIATGMGGASMAYDNGNAAMANNPATLGLMKDGTNRLDVALGGLHPSITSKMPTMPDAKSGGTGYYMPAVGWSKKEGALAYGVGMFAVGGMGTEYTANDWVGAGSGKPSRSEVSVGNVIVPLSYDVTPDLTIAGSLDLVWGGMDLQMAMTTAQMGALAAGGNLTATGAAAAALPPFLGGATNIGYFNFTDGSAFTGKANSTGWAGKLGMTYKVSDQLTLGATYHSKTSIGDMTTGGAQMQLIDNAGSIGPAGTTYTLNGNISVVNFQFPENYGFGMALQATDDLLIAVDYKRIGWAKVMKDFHMTFSSADMGGINMDMKMPQNWKDQDVFNIGVAYRTSDALILRAGTNLSSNPVPDNTVNPLFPATIKNHYTVGAGYAFDKVSDLNVSLSYAPKVTVTAPAAAGGYTIDHSQLNWQLMYSHRF